MTQAYKNLWELRERFANLRAGTVADLAGIGRERLNLIEQGAPPSVFELERLALVYGIDADALWDDPIVVDDADAVGVLTSQEEFRGVGDLTRARMLRAASAARDLRTLRGLLGDAAEPPPRLPSPPPSLTPYQQGAALAEDLRRRLSLGVRAIPSMHDLVASALPSIAVLYADLGREGPAGLSFVDPTRGPAIVLNLRGKNENAAVRRFSLAHELCHLLADWNHADPLASISGYVTDAALPREQRANGFAVRLLCPETVVQRLSAYREEDAARMLIEEYRLHYQAARLYLRNEAGLHLPQQPAPSLHASVADPTLDRAEQPHAIDDFPLAEVPFERRGLVAAAAVRAWSRDLISRDAAARYLGVTPGSEIERVADYFGEDFPEERPLTG